MTDALLGVHVRRHPDDPDGTVRIGVEGECVDGAGIFWSRPLSYDEVVRLVDALLGSSLTWQPEPVTKRT